MTLEGFADREALVLRHLTEAAADRAAVEAELAARFSQETASIEAEHKRFITAAAATYGQEFRAAESALALELAAFDSQRAASLESLTAKSQTDEQILATKATDHKRRVEKDHQDSKWLADTMIEPGEIKLRDAANNWTRISDTLRKDAAKLLDLHVNASSKRVAAQLQEPLTPAPVEIIGTGPQPAHELGTLELKALADELHAFRAAANPITGRIGVSVVVGLLVGLAGAAAALAAKSAPAMMAGAGVGAALLAVGVCQLIAASSRRHLPIRLARVRERLARIESLAPIIAERATLERSEGSVWLRKRRDDEIHKANEQYRGGMRAVDKLLKIELPDFRARTKADLEKFAAQTRSDRAAIESRAKVAIDAITATRDRIVTEADAGRLARRAAMDAQKESVLLAAQSRWKDRTTSAYAALNALLADVAIADTPHDDPLPPDAPARTAPRGLRFGTLTVNLASLPGIAGSEPGFSPLPGPESFELPTMFDLAGRGGMLIFAGDRAEELGDGREASLSFVRTIMSRLLTRLPPGKLRFTIFDPVGLGQNFAGFMHLADVDPLLINGRIWTESKDIEQRLADLTEHMETVIQKYLRNEYAAIQDYNVAAGEVAEPYRFLILADFPTNISEQAARRLASIVNSGARCGVFTIIAADARDRVALKGPLADLEKSCLTMTRRHDRFVIDAEPFTAWPLEVLPAPNDAQLTEIVKEVGEKSKDASRVRVPFTMITPDAARLWSLSSAQDFSVPLGRAGAKKLQHLVFGRGTAQHGLIAGRTGSGKSTLLHVIITNAAMWFGPDQLELYLVDFKKGVEFKPYAAAGLPHARVIAIESEREFGLSVLKRLDEELTRRGELLRDVGVQDLAGYRRLKGESTMPRILLVVDEFQEFFTQDDRIGADAALLMDRLVRQGRAFGIHALLGSQTLGGAFSIARSTIGQMAVRIALQCAEADSYLILSEDNAAARLLTRPGEAIYNDASGMVEGNSPFQIAWLDDAQRVSSLAEVTAAVRARGITADRCVVFEGNQPADVRSNACIIGSIATDASSPESPAIEDPQRRLWIGEPLAIKPPASIPLRRESAANVLLVGSDADAIAGMVSAALLGISAWSGSAERPIVRIILAGAPDESATEILPEIARRINADVRVVPVRQSESAVREIAALLDAGERDISAPPALLVIWGLQRCRDLRRADEFDFSAPANGEESLPKALARILVEGPPQGVHVLACCDSLTNLERTLDRPAIREFGVRIVTQMSPSDSTSLIDSPAASDLGRHRALFHIVDAGSIEKFRPYRLPDRSWLDLTPARPPNPEERGALPSA